MKKEPNNEDNVSCCPQFREKAISTSNAVSNTMTKVQPGINTSTCVLQNTTEAKTSKLKYDISDEFSCWLCDFKFKERIQIDAHLRERYANEADLNHSQARISKLFSLDNPATLIITEKGTVFLKCTKCDEINQKLSTYLIHAMMHCPHKHTGPVHYSGPERGTTVFKVITAVESGKLKSASDQEYIRGANDISICGQIECGSLLNRFDVRPHKCQSARNSASSKLDCKFSKCNFMGDKKQLIEHYGTQHLIRLTNVRIQPEIEAALDSVKNFPPMNLRKLLEFPVHQIGVTLVPTVPTVVQGALVNTHVVGMANQTGMMSNGETPNIAQSAMPMLSQGQGQVQQRIQSVISPNAYYSTQVAHRPIVSNEQQATNNYISSGGSQAGFNTTSSNSNSAMLRAQSGFVNSGVRTANRSNTAIRSFQSNRGPPVITVGVAPRYNVARNPQYAQSTQQPHQRTYRANDTYQPQVQAQVSYGGNQQGSSNAQRFYFHPQNPTTQLQNTVGSVQAIPVTMANRQHYYPSAMYMYMPPTGQNQVQPAQQQTAVSQNYNPNSQSYTYSNYNQ